MQTAFCVLLVLVAAIPVVVPTVTDSTWTTGPPQSLTYSPRGIVKASVLAAGPPLMLAVTESGSLDGTDACAIHLYLMAGGVATPASIGCVLPPADDHDSVWRRSDRRACARRSVRQPQHRGTLTVLSSDFVLSRCFFSLFSFSFFLSFAFFFVHVLRP